MAKKSKANWEPVEVGEASRILDAPVPAGFVSEVGGSGKQRITLNGGFALGTLLRGGSVNFTINEVAEIEIIETTRTRIRRA
jgi:hypothetical protein